MGYYSIVMDHAEVEILFDEKVGVGDADVASPAEGAEEAEENGREARESAVAPRRAGSAGAKDMPDENAVADARSPKPRGRRWGRRLLREKVGATSSREARGADAAPPAERREDALENAGRGGADLETLRDGYAVVCEELQRLAHRDDGTEGLSESQFLGEERDAPAAADGSRSGKAKKTECGQRQDSSRGLRDPPPANPAREIKEDSSVDSDNHVTTMSDLTDEENSRIDIPLSSASLEHATTHNGVRANAEVHTLRTLILPTVEELAGMTPPRHISEEERYQLQKRMY